MLIGGISSFSSLGKKEDAPFVIKSAVIMTRYPGAEPAEVERLITEPISREIQSMSGVYKIKSESMYGISKIIRIISKIQICPFCFFTLYSKGGKFKLFTRSLFIFSYFQQTTITITQKTKIVSQGIIIHFVPIFPNSCRYQ